MKTPVLWTVGPRHLRRVVVGALAIGCVTAATSCGDRAPTAPPRSIVDLVAKGQFQVVIQEDRQVSGDSAVFLVQVVGNGVSVASYQGTLTFNPAVFQVLSVKTPMPQSGEFFVANPNDAAKGQIRFAGFATTQFDSIQALRIVARLSGGLSAATLAATIDVAGTETGMSVPRSQLHGSSGVRDAVTNALIQN